MIWLFTLSLAVVVAVTGTPAAAAALAVDGPVEVVTDWATDRCADNDIPDAAARAFRDGNGQVHLFAAHFVGRALTGPRLDAVKPDCRIAFQGAGNDDPAALDDRIWLTSFFTADGTRVHALGHAEFHGHLRRRLCPSGGYMECWWNAVVQVVSTDGGATFHRLTGAGTRRSRRCPTATRASMASRPATSRPATSSPRTAFSVLRRFKWI